MSAADGWSRRSVIGAGAGLVLASTAAAVAPDRVRAPAGDFLGDRQGSVTAFRGIRYGRAERFRAPVAVASPGRRVEARGFGRSPRNRTRSTGRNPKTACFSTSGAPSRGAARTSR